VNSMGEWYYVITPELRRYGKECMKKFTPKERRIIKKAAKKFWEAVRVDREDKEKWFTRWWRSLKWRFTR